MLLAINLYPLLLKWLPVISFGRFVDSHTVTDETLMLHLNSTIKFLYKQFSSLKIYWGNIN